MISGEGESSSCDSGNYSPQPRNSARTSSGSVRTTPGFRARLGPAGHSLGTRSVWTQRDMLCFPFGCFNHMPSVKNTEFLWIRTISASLIRLPADYVDTEALIDVPIESLSSAGHRLARKTPVVGEIRSISPITSINRVRQAHNPDLWTRIPLDNWAELHLHCASCHRLCFCLRCVLRPVASASAKQQVIVT